MSRSYWNPFTTYAIACALVVPIYLLRYSSLYPELSVNLALFLAFSFGVSVLLAFPVMKTPLTAITPARSAAPEMFLAALICAGFVAEVVHFGGVPLLQALQGRGVNYQQFGIPTFHVVLYGVTVFFSVFWWDSYLVTRRLRYLIMSSLGPLMCVLIFSRGGLLIQLFSFIFAYGNRVGLHKRFKLLAAIALLVILGFGYLGEVRMGTAGRNLILSIGGANQSFADSGLPDPVFWFYLYVSSPLANLQNTELHRSSDVLQMVGFAADFLPDFLSKYFVTPEQYADIDPVLVTPELTVGTAYARPLMALGWLGPYALHVYSLCFFYVSMFFARKSSYYGAVLAIMCTQGCLMFFDNMIEFSGAIAPVLVGIGLIALQGVRVVPVPR